MVDARSTVNSVKGAATGGVRRVLQLEAFAIMATALAAYFVSGGSPWLLAIVFFMPDLSFAAFAFGARAGAVAYNAVHSYTLAILVGGAGWLSGVDLLWQVALILVAHAGFDRALGYGLKYANGFSNTHLGTIGRGHAKTARPDLNS